jgi:hypothetical protein
VVAALRRCEPDERAVIEALYFRGQTMHAFAAELGRARQHGVAAARAGAAAAGGLLAGDEP